MRRIALPRLLAATGMWLASAGFALALDMGGLTGEVWGSGNRALVVILHGDGGPGRYDGFARQSAQRHQGTTVVTLNRPGYSYKGKKSPGRGGKGMPDLYTRRANDAVAKSIRAMQADLKPRRTVVIGHSGGSGQLGSIIGRYPGIANAALLVSCPCNVPQWRVHRRGRNNWTNSQSPDSFVRELPGNMPVYAIVGRRDPNTSPRFSKKYVEKANKAGKRNVKLVIVQNGNHSWSTVSKTVGQYLSATLK